LKRSAKALPEIAGELGANALVKGSVLHAGDRVRITVQLLRMDPEEHL
jgi:TolB-like protein